MHLLVYWNNQLILFKQEKNNNNIHNPLFVLSPPSLIVQASHPIA